jgi:hypothetical protein
MTKLATFIYGVHVGVLLCLLGTFLWTHDPDIGILTLIEAIGGTVLITVALVFTEQFKS